MDSKGKYSEKVYFEGERGVIRKRNKTMYMRSAKADKMWVCIKNNGGFVSCDTLKEAKLYA